MVQLITKDYGAMDASKAEEFSIWIMVINSMASLLKICSMEEVCIPKRQMILKYMAFGRIMNS